MKNRFILFLAIFIFMIIPKNVHALSLVPGWATINGTTFVANGQRQDVSITGYTNPNGENGLSTTFNLNIDVMYESDAQKDNYPYVLLYIKADTRDMKFTRTSSCTSSCFDDTINYSLMGTAPWNGWQINWYGVILPVKKAYYDENRAMYRVSDSISISSSSTTTVPWNVSLILFVNDPDFINNNQGIIINDNTNNNSIINNNNANTQSIINNQDSNTQSIIDNQNQNWNNFNNTDLSSTDKQAPDTQDYNNYQQAEQNLFGQMSNADISNVNIAIDSNSATWVWSRLTEWLNTNSLLMSFLISMLSIGIIKMALGR